MSTRKLTYGYIMNETYSKLNTKESKMNSIIFSTVREHIAFLAQSVNDIRSSPEVLEILDDVYKLSHTVGEFVTHSLLPAGTKSSYSIRDICREDFHGFDLLNSDSTRQILSYLEPADVCNVQCTCSFFRQVFIECSDSYWNIQLSWRFGQNYSGNQRYSYATYVDVSNRDLVNEISHISEMRLCHEAIRLYKSAYSRGVIGVISDLVYFDDENVARVISKKRFMAMRTIITETEQDVLNFKRYTRDLSGTPKSFLPLENAQRNRMLTLIEQEILHQKIEFPGFLGYVVNMIKLREEHEYLRLTVMWSLFRDMMVFETTADKLAYRALLEPAAVKDFWGVALNDYEDAVLSRTQPSFHAHIPRDLSKYSVPVANRIASLNVQLSNGLTSLALIRYSLA